MATVAVLENCDSSGVLPILGTWPRVSTLVILAFDQLAFATGLGGSVLAWSLITGSQSSAVLLYFWPCPLLILATFALSSLYPGVTSNAVSEIRRTTAANLKQGILGGVAADVQFMYTSVVHVAFAALVGFCLNTLVLRVDVSGQPTFADLLRRVREAVLESLAKRRSPIRHSW
jgi:hypothetical protein